MLNFTNGDLEVKKKNNLKSKAIIVFGSISLIDILAIEFLLIYSEMIYRTTFFSYRNY